MELIDVFFSTKFNSLSMGGKAYFTYVMASHFSLSDKRFDNDNKEIEFSNSNFLFSISLQPHGVKL